MQPVRRSWTRVPGRASAALLLGVCIGCGSSAKAEDVASDPSQAAPPLRLLRTLGGDADPLFQVRSAAFRGSDLVIVTGAEPFIHLYRGARSTGWGKKGQGPAEMQYPVDVAWDGARILVRDTNLEKVVSFDASGRFLASRALSPLVTDRMSLAGTDTLVGGVQLGRQLRAVLRLGGARPDTVLRFTLPQQLRLRTQGSPSLTLSPPYASITRWAALPDRGLAFWDARQPQVQVLDRAGRVKARLPLPSGNYPVTRADRESWLATAIPPSFMGKPVFEPLREYARGSVQFPARLPAVLDLVTDPSGGVWIRRTTPATGEVWTLLRNGGGGPTFRLGRGSRLLVVGEREVAVIATDENDVERVEIYAKPPGTARPAT